MIFFHTGLPPAPNSYYKASSAIRIAAEFSASSAAAALGRILAQKGNLIAQKGNLGQKRWLSQCVLALSTHTRGDKMSTVTANFMDFHQNSYIF